MPRGLKLNTIKRIVFSVLFVALIINSGYAKPFSQDNSKSHKKAILNKEAVNAEEIFKEIQSVKGQALICMEIVQNLKRYHYKDTILDDTFSSMVFDRYISDLDNHRSYFFEKDIKQFEAFRKLFDDAYTSGNLKAAYLIYNRYYQRIIERLVKLIQHVEKGVAEMDFTKDEFIEIDRKEAPWFKTTEEMDEYWRKRLKNSVLSLKLAEKPIEEIPELLSKRYRSQLNRIAQTNSEDVFRTYMNAFCQSYDPHTTYFSPRISEDFDIQMSLSLEGIGAVLQSKNEFTTISRLVPAGPADKSELLKPGDRIIGVAQGIDGEIVDVVGWRLDEVVQLIRGPKKTIVRLEIIPSDAVDDHQTKVINITRNTVKLEEQAARKEIIEKKVSEKTYKIGLIDIPAFYLDFKGYQNSDMNYKSTTRDVRRILLEFAQDNVDGVLVDLRDKGGGALQEANLLTGLFIKKGPTVQVKQENGRIKSERDEDPEILYSGPLVVMVDRMSASASEIFAGAIQDYNRGIVVGSQTFGKGTVQRLDPLMHGQLKLTVAKFYRISGNSTQHKGVIPDIIFPSIYNIDKIGESAYPEALKWDKIRPTSYYPYYDLTDYVVKLRMNHNQRIIKDPDFQYLVSSINRINEVRSKTKVFLNEKKREEETEKSTKWRLDVENKRRIAKGLEPVSEIPELDSSENENELKKSNDEKSEEESDSDPLLVESQNILVDFISFLNEKKHSEKAVSKL